MICCRVGKEQLKEVMEALKIHQLSVPGHDRFMNYLDFKLKRAARFWYLLSIFIVWHSGEPFARLSPLV